MRARGDAAFLILIGGFYLSKGLQLHRSRKPSRIRRKQGEPCNGLCNRCRLLDYISPIVTVWGTVASRFEPSRRNLDTMMRRMSRMSNGARLDFADEKKSLAAVDIQFRLRNAAHWQRKFSMADYPNPPLSARKTSLRLSSMATLVTPSNVLTVFGCCGSDRSIRRTVSVGRLAAPGADAAAIDPDLRSGTKAIANADPDGGKLMFPAVGSGKAFRSSRTGLAAFVTSTIAKVFFALRRNRYPFSPRRCWSICFTGIP